MQTQGNIGIFRGIRAGFFNINFIEGELLGTFTSDVFERHRFMTKVLQRQTVHIVAGGDGIEHIGFKHGVKLHTLHVNAVVSQHVHIVFHMLADFFMFTAFQ